MAFRTSATTARRLTDDPTRPNALVIPGLGAVLLVLEANHRQWPCVQARALPWGTSELERVLDGPQRRCPGGAVRARPSLGEGDRDRLEQGITAGLLLPLNTTLGTQAATPGTSRGHARSPTGTTLPGDCPAADAGTRRPPGCLGSHGILARGEHTIPSCPESLASCPRCPGRPGWWSARCVAIWNDARGRLRGHKPQQSQTTHT